MRPNRQTRVLADELLGTTQADPTRGIEGGWEQRLVVAIQYDKGGMNYFTYKTDPRGYSVTVRFVERKREEHVTSERFTMGGAGVRSFLEPAHAFSAKKLASLQAPGEIVEQLRAHVLAQRADLAQRAARAD